MFNINRCAEDASVYKEAIMPEKTNFVNNNSFIQNSNFGCEMRPIFEPMQERICHKEFIHEVPHVCPINTRVINHHIYRHTYTPCYTCCEENEVCNVYDNCCNNF